ncbi:pentapeptide repeat-containing protein [Desulfonatronum sp. SC1]|uniref:pentapeptide repeat-containing protein n=1 Tax=Desulfonatronum sp. SC1 TaxID=2109626 RepID=UPI000D3193B5|nr:pentapeptide repeat-containing protein [Desulfonatronum sp. SC1]PTN33039.1 hypothetical protein C6366_15480 [Desulfonatronum sp. SC1]
MAALGCLLTVGQAGAWDHADLKKLRDTNACSGCELAGAPLSDANLIGADLSGANLAGTNLKGANLSGATWTDGRQCAQGSISECK